MSDQTYDSDSSKSMLSTGIEALDLSTRAYNALKRRGINTVGQILSLGEEGVLDLYQIGPSTSDRIFDSVAQYIGISRASLAELKLPENGSIEEKIPPQIAELPISVLGLPRRITNPLTFAGIGTIGDLLRAQSRGYDQFRWVGKQSADDIEKSLAQFLEGPDSLTHQELEYLRDPRPYLIEIDLRGVPNLVRLIVPFSRTLLKSLEYEREYEVLKRRYGLEGSDIYTLQEIGYYYDITRERVRQIEAKALRKIRDLLVGTAESKLWRVPDNVRKEASDLSSLLRSGDRVLTEREIIRVVEDRYGFTLSAREPNVLRFLLTALGFRPLPSSIGVTGFCGDLSPAWLMVDDLEKPTLYRAVKAVHRALQTSVMPLSLFDLKIKGNRRRKKKIDTEYIRYAIDVCYEIEWVDHETCQIKFEYLPSLADKAHRILWEASGPMHIRDIWRQTNHRLAKAGFPAKVRMRSLSSQLPSDPRFKPIGRSGIWSLSEWEHVRRETIVDLLQEFFHLRQSGATVDEAFEYVRDRRADASRQSVITYLSTQKQLFTRVSETEYELSAWGGKPYERGAHSGQEQLRSEIKTIFSDKQVTNLPLSELVRELMDRTGMANSTVYRKLHQSSLIELEPHPSHPKAKIAHYTGIEQPAHKAAKRKPFREAVQEEIKGYLGKQPDRRAPVADVASYVIKVTNCKKGTFYRYLSELTEMADVRKEYEGNKLYCYMAAEVGGEPLSFPQIERIEDESLRENLYRAIRNLNIENVDLGLFHLGKIFENELKAIPQKLL